MRKENSQIDLNDSTVKDYGWGQRHIIIALLFFYNALGTSHKVNLSFGIVCMMDNSHNPEFKEYDWSEQIRGFVLSSLYWGYTIGPFPCGILTQKYSPKTLLIIATGIGSMLTVAIPFVADISWMFLCIVRFIIGLTHGFIYPCTFRLVSKWTHPTERTFLLTILFLGAKLGVSLTLFISGSIVATSMGWPAIFYLTGGVGFLWIIIWYFIAEDTPNEYKIMSSRERDYIQSGYANQMELRKMDVPWKCIFQSTPFWALVFTSFMCSWAFYLLLNEIPTFINGILYFDIKSNATISGLPYICMTIMLLLFGYICNLIIKRKWTTVSAARKIFNSIGTFLPAIALVYLGFITENVTVAIILLNFIVAINAADNVGFLINHLDLAPNFAGILVGATGVANNLSSIIGPIFVGYVVTDTHNPEMWRIVFLVTAAMLIGGNLIFLLFGSGNIQEWNNGRSDKKSKNATNVDNKPGIIEQS